MTGQPEQRSLAAVEERPPLHHALEDWQLRVMRRIAEARGPVRITDLQAAAGATEREVGKLVRWLEGRGAVRVVTGARPRFASVVLTDWQVMAQLVRWSLRGQL